MEPLQDGLEGVIESGELPDDHSTAGAYLKRNPAAREEVTAMIEISRFIRETLSVAPDEIESLEPAPGFYSRVLARIEAENGPPSFWSFFLEPFGRRLVYASLGLAGLLFAATFLDTAPPEPPSVATIPVERVVHGAILASDGDGLPIMESSSRDEDRGATLVQLTTYNQ
ncbi:hypothetical protein [Bryobacter aggregatus]|uniref:hypothetical protein n=1 Tax=Bryobacter aggregatus TaxID=360054 RepID=UPI0004E1AB6A|nr:hypothetical protein [Bryobacter aggregatus]